jgi:ATP-binding cassette subfamily B protein
MLKCRQCGSASDEQASFCWHCGHPLAGPFTQLLRGRGETRSIERTAHFELQMPAGSFAERRAQSIGSALESLRDAAGQILALTDAELAGPYRVYLGDVLPAPAGERSAESCIVPERDEVWAVYRPDAPGVELTRSVVRLLVLRGAGFDLALLPALWAGFAGLCEARSQRAPLEPETSRSLTARFGRRPPSLGRLLGQEEPVDASEAGQLAQSFLAFLLERDGPGQLSAYLAATVTVSPEEGARSVYKTALKRLQQEWWASVRRRAVAGGSGILRFLRSSLRYLRPYWKEEIVIFALLLVQLAFQQILPRAQALLIDKAILPRDLQYLIGLAIFLFVLVAVTLFAGVLRDYLTTRVSESVLRGLRERIFDQLQRASHRFYSRMDTGDVLSRFANDLRSVEQGLTSTLSQGVFLVLGLLLSMAHVALISLPLALIVFAALPLFLLTTRVLGPPANRASLTYAEEQAAITNTLQENLGAQPVIKAYNLQVTMARRFRNEAESLLHSAVRLFFLGSLFGVSASLLSTILQVGMLALGGYFVLEGRLALGSLIEFLSLLALVIGPVQSVTGILQSVQIATASMDRVEEILNLEPDVADAAGARELGPVRHSIRLEDVTFSYEGGQAQLDGVSIEIPAGSTAAFVGPSGSGKSTIVSLLLRFYDPDRGRVLFDGQDLREVSLESLRRQTAAVFQESFLFNTSVRENIRYGREGAADAEVEAAARQAEIHDAILELPQGYDTVVGERGGSLSGGQRQRLAIARAILRGASVLIFDEATSALDASTESAILQSIEALSQGRTTVWVTHRLASAAKAGRIFVLERGRVVEQGTHEELLRLNGLYRRLYEDQGGAAAEGQQALALSYLRGVPIFADLAPAMLGSVAGFLRSDPIHAGEVVVEAGAEADKLYLIVWGEFEVLGPAGADAGRPLAVLGPGDYFGDVALLRDVPRTATVRARTAGHVLTLQRQALFGLFSLIPELRSSLEARLAAREAGASTGGAAAAREARTPPDAVLLQYPAGGPARHFPLDRPETSVGRDARNDIALSEPSVSGFHARILRDADGGYLIVDCGSTNGTTVNGRMVGTQPVPLVEGDMIRLGRAALTLHYER